MGSKKTTVQERQQNAKYTLLSCRLSDVFAFYSYSLFLFFVFHFETRKSSLPSRLLAYTNLLPIYDVPCTGLRNYLSKSSSLLLSSSYFFSVSSQDRECFHEQEPYKCVNSCLLPFFVVKGSLVDYTNTLRTYTSRKRASNILSPTGKRKQDPCEIRGNVMCACGNIKISRSVTLKGA